MAARITVVNRTLPVAFELLAGWIFIGCVLLKNSKGDLGGDNALAVDVADSSGSSETYLGIRIATKSAQTMGNQVRETSGPIRAGFSPINDFYRPHDLCSQHGTGQCVSWAPCPAACCARLIAQVALHQLVNGERNWLAG